MQGPVAMILLSWNVILRHTLIKNIFDIFVDTLSLYIFTIWKSIVYNLFCRDGIYFDKILVSEYKLLDTASSASFLDLYLEFDDSGQLSTKICDKL
jgi:hypothetical protein